MNLILLVSLVILNSQAVLDVPAYQQGYMCGPTALGMIVGYYDVRGYPSLFPESTDINQIITEDLSRYMKTNAWGWSLSKDVGQAFVSYVDNANPKYEAGYEQYWPGDGSMSWDVLVKEINAGRPMLFLLDRNADGISDHFVTVIGYRTSPYRQYAMYDTWSKEIRWIDYAPAVRGTSWGVWSAWRFYIEMSYTSSMSMTRLVELWMRN